MISLRPLNYSSTSRPTPEISVDTDEGYVDLTLESDTGETFDDRNISRTLDPSEARALAAMLWHFADMAER